MAMTTIIHLRAALEALSEFDESCRSAYDVAYYRSRISPKIDELKRRVEQDLRQEEALAITAIRDQQTPGGAK